MNINRMTLKVEARNNRTVALNDLAYWQNRLIVLRDRFIRGSLTKADYLEYRESAKRRMAYAALMLRVAIRDIATLCR